MSLINPNNINGGFPVFGQDNPTQGFRDNFTNIKNNLNFAKQEIEDLQNKAVLKTALTGTTLTNDLQGAVLENPQLKAYTVSYYDLDEQSGNVAVDFEVGNFQKITTTGDVNLSLVNWPATSGSGLVGYASLRLWLVIGQAFNETFGTVIPHSVTLPPTVNIGIADITGYVAATNTITFDVPGNYIFDISSADGGLTYLIFDNTRNRVRFRDSYFYFNPDVTGDNNVLLLGYGPALPLALAVEREGRDTVSARGSFASFESVLYHNNELGFGDGISGNLNFAGYSVASSRSFIAANSVLINQGLGSKDQIGYFNAIGAVGNPANIGNLTTATFGTIEFATNSDLPTYITSLFIPPYGSIDNYSPGGNITFRTKQDYGLFGLTTWPRSDSPMPPGTITAPGGLLAKAMSLENDQSVRFYGATTRAYQVINLDTDLDGLGTANVSPYVSEVILDSNTSPFAGAAIILPPAFALKDGQELNISSNVAIGALTVIPATGNVTIPVQKQTAFAVGDGTNVTIFFDNSGNLFSTGGAVLITDFIPAELNSVAPFFANLITGFSASSITISSSGLIGNVTYPGNVTTATNFVSNTSVTGAPTLATIAAGTNYKWIYNETKKHWHKIG
jgi:hypothetical protein